jgi:hypothetical protein
MRPVRERNKAAKIRDLRKVPCEGCMCYSPLEEPSSDRQTDFGAAIFESTGDANSEPRAI